MEKYYESDKYKLPFDERLIEIVRGRKYNPYEYLKPFPQIYHAEEPICVHYNPKQKAIASFGIAFYNAVSSRWLVVEPKFTIEFISLMKGAYNKHFLPFLLDVMYSSELLLILTDPSPKDPTDSAAKRIYRNIHDKLFSTTTIHVLYETIWMDNYPLISSIAHDILSSREKTGEVCMQAVFPKGRAGSSESWIRAALREVSEETGITINFDNPSQTMDRLNGKFVLDTESNIWEPCHVKIQGEDIDGYLSKTYVSHTHSTFGGKLYRTVIWLCVINKDIEDFQVTENSETRSGEWLKDEDMRKRFRVQDLYTKCETSLNKYYPYLTL